MPVLDSPKTNEMNQKYTFLILISILGVILLLSGAAYRYRGELQITKRLSTLKEHFASPGVAVKFDIIVSMEEQCLRIGFSVPCRDLRQRNKLLKSLPAIKNAILMSVSRPEVARLIEKRDFGAIKKLSLGLINNYSTERRKELYLDYFFLD